MIRRTLEVLRNELQYFLDLKDPDRRISSNVVLSNLLDEKGDTIFTSEDGEKSGHYLILTLVNIAQENHRKPPVRHKELAGQQLGKINPVINLNLYVLFAAHSFTQYETSLALISNVIGFFQTKPYFDQDNTPSLPSGIQRITADLQSLTFEQQNYLWGLLGAKYMPSVIYKLRTVSIDEEHLINVGSAIQTLDFLE